MSDLGGDGWNGKGEGEEGWEGWNGAWGGSGGGGRWEEQARVKNNGDHDRVDWDRGIDHTVHSGINKAPAGVEGTLTRKNCNIFEDEPKGCPSSEPNALKEADGQGKIDDSDDRGWNEIWSGWDRGEKASFWNASAHNEQSGGRDGESEDEAKAGEKETEKDQEVEEKSWAAGCETKGWNGGWWGKADVDVANENEKEEEEGIDGHEGGKDVNDKTMATGWGGGWWDDMEKSTGWGEEKEEDNGWGG